MKTKIDMQAIIVCAAFMLAAGSAQAADAVSEYVGLWVGAVGLQTVTDVSTTLDKDNNEVRQAATLPTPTSDRADIRLILHVNAAGQVSLLKDVAVVNRNPSGSASATAAKIAALGSDELSLSLVTDPSLYAEYPMQKAIRYSCVAFDFGDAAATRVLDAMVDKVVADLKTRVYMIPETAVDTAAKRNALVDSITASLLPSLAADVVNSDVSAAYQGFLDSVKSFVTSIADSANLSAGAAKTWFTTATTLCNTSSFGDTRAMDFVREVQAVGDINNYADAWNTAANFADVGNEVHRLLSGQIASDALIAASRHAASNSLATVANLRSLNASTLLINGAEASKKWSNDDTRATGAVDEMFICIAAAAQAGHDDDDMMFDEIQRAAAAAGHAALLEALAKYPPNTDGPTPDYNAFVASKDYIDAPEIAARAAVAAALSEIVANPLTYHQTAGAVAEAAARNALQAVYTAAARAKLHELPLAGSFGLGNGDSRFTMSLTNALGAAGLTGQIFLPANHASNPFRHRRHPDHSRGFDITRNIRIDFDAPDASGVIPSVTRGVSTVSGLYREEVFGLHKPLGAGKDVGLRTEGRFQLNRVSTIGVLNGKQIEE